MTYKLAFQEERALAKANLVGTMLALYPEWKLSFELKLHEIIPEGTSVAGTQPGWSNVLHMTAFGGDHQKYGDRTPALFIRHGTTKVHVFSPINKKSNYHFHTDSLALNQWTKIEVEQKKTAVAGDYEFTASVDGTVIHPAINYNAKTFHNVACYASNQWYMASKASIRNFCFSAQKSE